ncbi:sodium/hydrogen exchanger 9B1-like isoform X2 [Choristoneura fumiferana]|uniref:sodium/hydrogen exchanger 9B1-like isoform X2 n=1 Tax=Choristoneura fumiferana TaxID=7141 RepID=UPI003D15A8A7
MNEDQRLLVIMAVRPREGDAIRHSLASTAPPNITAEKNKEDNVKNKSEDIRSKTAALWTHFFTLTILGVMMWGLLWCAWGPGWRWDGPWVRLGAVAVVGWSSGQALQALTTMPPLLAALLTGILARNIGFLDMRDFIEIDGFLRKVYPVVILGKASLGWNVDYMRRNWLGIAALGVLPWAVEVTAVAACAHFVLDFPWLWGFLLGSIHASVSCAVVMPGVIRLGASCGSGRNWVQLVCTAGGTDTALSVGVYGLFFSFMFHAETDVYKYVKAGSTLFVGVVLGVAWGSLAKFVPHAQDYYVTELRILFVLVGGLLANFLLLHLGWAGTAGVAVLACNATAAMHWARNGWPLNNNAAATAYRVLWAALEPTLFSFTGTFFAIDHDLWNVMLVGLGILFLCLVLRLAVAALVCWDMTLREKLFVCCTWIPKSIVEAVLGPLALTTVISRGSYKGSETDYVYAETLMKILIQAIIITTPIGYLLTNYLGPKLLKKPKKDCENNVEQS